MAQIRPTQHAQDEHFEEVIELIFQGNSTAELLRKNPVYAEEFLLLLPLVQKLRYVALVKPPPSLRSAIVNALMTRSAPRRPLSSQ